MIELNWTCENQKKRLNKIVQFLEENCGAYLKYANWFIIPDNHLELIPKELTKTLIKDWNKYSLYSQKIITQSEFQKKEEEQKKREIEYIHYKNIVKEKGKRKNSIYAKDLNNNKDQYIKFKPEQINIDYLKKELKLIQNSIVIELKTKNENKINILMDIFKEGFNYKVENNLIILESKDYWNIYKEKVNGKEIVKGTGYTMKINNNEVKFCQPDYYFKDNNIGLYLIEEIYFIY